MVKLNKRYSERQYKDVLYFLKTKRKLKRFSKHLNNVHNSMDKVRVQSLGLIKSREDCERISKKLNAIHNKL